jgi:hypothetical protein
MKFFLTLGFYIFAGFFIKFQATLQKKPYFLERPLIFYSMFDSLERKILTVWKGKFWQFKKGNFDSLEREILTVWKGKFWQFEKGNFDSLEKGNFDSLEREILNSFSPLLRRFWTGTK